MAEVPVPKYITPPWTSGPLVQFDKLNNSFSVKEELLGADPTLTDTTLLYTLVLFLSLEIKGVPKPLEL